jgi:hypothetical protein
MRRASLAWCLILTGCACNGGDPGPPRVDVGAIDGGRAEDAGRDASFDANVAPGSDLAIALEMLCDARAHRSCTAPWACGCDYHDTFSFIPDRPVDEAACIAAERAQCDLDLVEQFRAAFASGWTMDEVHARNCIAARRAINDLCLPSPSATSADMPGSCRDAMTSDAEIGAVCDGPGIRCARGGGLCEDGRCRALPSSPGAACSDLCALGLRCVMGVCRDAVESGGACADHEDCDGSELCLGGHCGLSLSASGEACESTSDCSTGLSCRDGVCTAEPGALCAGRGAASCGAATTCSYFPPGVCTPLAGIGAPCFDSFTCSEPLVCVRVIHDSPGSCAPPPGLGEPCYRDCAGDLVCIGRRDPITLEPLVPNAVCVPALEAGAPCRRGTGECGSGLACVGGACGPPPGLGEECQEDYRCADGLRCLISVPVSGPPSCRPVVPEGGACTDDLECAERGRSGLECVDGTCIRLHRAARGEACEFRGLGCEPGSDCVWTDGVGFRCEAPGMSGADCDSECMDGAWCDDQYFNARCVPDICPQLFPDHYIPYRGR